MAGVHRFAQVAGLIAVTTGLAWFGWQSLQPGGTPSNPQRTPITATSIAPPAHPVPIAAAGPARAATIKHAAGPRAASMPPQPGTAAIAEAPSCPSPDDSPQAASDRRLDNACVAAYVAELCANGDIDLTGKLAAYLGTHPINVRKGLGRYNVLNLQSFDSWCDLPAPARLQAIAIARTPKKSPDMQATEANREYLMLTMSDGDGTIDAGGYSSAVAQRRLLLPDNQVVSKTSDIPSTSESRPASGIAPITSTPLSAGLPASPAGWTNLSGYAHPVGRINDLLIDNVGTTATRTMWAGTDGGGIWKTTDGGTSWVPVNDFNGSLAIGKILRSPVNALVMYASTNPYGSHTYSPFGMLKSTDGGVTWSQLAQTNPATNGDWQYVTHLAIHPAGVAGQDVLLAATNSGTGVGGVYQSTDSGATWTKVSTNSIASFVGFHPADGNRRAYALNNGTLTITTNGNWAGAATYTILAGATSSYTKFAFAASDVNVMYAQVSGAGGTTNLMRSATGGSSWAPLTPPTGFFYNSNYLYYTGGLWVDPTNPGRIVMLEALAASTANAPAATASSWAQTSNFWIDHHGAVADPGYNGTSNKIIYLMDDGGLYKFNDVDTLTGGQYLALGMTITEVYTTAGRGGNLVLGAQDVGARHYRTAPPDMVQKWRLPSGPGIGDGAGTAADPTNPNILYGSNQYQRLNRSSDGGATTVAICQGITDITCGGAVSNNAAFIAPFMLDPNTPATMLAGTGSLWRSTNVSSGAPPAWATIHSGVGSVIQAIAVAKTDSNIIWVAYQNGAVYKTANGLSATPTWTPVATAPAGTKLRFFIDRTNSQRVFLGMSGFSGNKLHVTTNGGSSWSPVTGLPAASVFAIEQHPANPAWLYVGTAVGLFASTDGGTSWSASNEGPANVQVRDLSWYSEIGNSADLLVGTFGRGVWRATLQAGSGFLLTINKPGAGAGTVTSNPAGINCGAGCSNIFTAASMVTLTATPNANSTFAGWSGGGCSGTGTCTVTMSAAQTVSATFDLLPEAFPVGCALPAGWTVPGTATAGWSAAIDRMRSGACSLKSDDIVDSNIQGVFTKAQIQTTANFQAGNVSFYYNVSSELNWDCLRFIVDTVQQAISGTCTNYAGQGASGDISTWTLVTVPITAGTHTLLWSYEKDYTVSTGGDAGWIDDVILPPLAAAGTLQFTSPTLSVAENIGNAVVSVSRSGGSTGAVSVNYATASGTATAGPDFTGQTGSLNWANGDAANKTISIPIIDDALAESSETFTVTLSAPVGAALGAPASTTVTILDNDTFTIPGAPTIGAATPGNGVATIAFAPPASDGGSPIIDYTVTCNVGGFTATGPGSPLTVIGLTNTVSYTCSVTARNAIGTGPASGTVAVTPQAGAALALVAVQSRKTHTGIGSFDLPITTGIPINGLVSVEPRNIGAGHSIVFQFNNNVTVPGTVTAVDSVPAPIGSPTAVKSGNELIVTLTGVPDGKRVTVTLAGVNNSFGTSVSMGFLVGDVNGTGAVNASDISAVKAHIGQPTNAGNFRFDLNATGAVSATDLSVVKARSGLVLP